MADPFIAMIQRQVKSARKAEFEASGQMALGDLIDALAMLQADLPVVFGEAEDATPVGFDSYRGYYDELALEWVMGDPISVKTLREMAESADGSTFTGYKGGEYSMDRSTPMWVSNYGESSGVMLVGILDDGDRIVLETREEEF